VFLFQLLEYTNGPSARSAGTEAANHLGFPPWQFRGLVRRHGLDASDVRWFPSSVPIYPALPTPRPARWRRPDLPDDLIIRNSCQARSANQLYILTHPALTKRGASRSSRNVGAGCDGRIGVSRRSAPVRTAKACGPVPRWRCNGNGSLEKVLTAAARSRIEAACERSCRSKSVMAYAALQRSVCLPLSRH
jgi:hypothetical protein